MVKKISAGEYSYKIIKEGRDNTRIYPYLRDPLGKLSMYCIGPLHGRSFVVDKKEDRFVVSKGNGLSYTQHDFLFTGELSDLGDDALGLLLKQDAVRDFNVGQDVAALGIKTNHMEYVLELDKQLFHPNGHLVHPFLLQYSVECPYRICDVPFMDQSILKKEIEKWEQYNSKRYRSKHLIAADVMIHNLRLMHNNGILHNAIHEQNYTWALELLDFELGRSPQHPYERADYERHVESLSHREAFQTYVIINYIAWALKEEIDYPVVDNLFLDYGYDLNKYKVQ